MFLWFNSDIFVPGCGLHARKHVEMLDGVSEWAATSDMQ